MKRTDLPFVSIVFTSYNHRRFLRKALERLLYQTYPNYEVIVIDDCSTDGSQDIIKEYADHPRLRMELRTTNSGSYVKASNYGASFANGTILMFAQCDDYADATQLEKLVNAMLENENAGVVFSKSNLIDEHDAFIADDFTGRESAFREKCKNNTLITKQEMIRFLSYSCVLPNLSAAIIRKDLFHAIGGFSEKYLVMSDWGFWLDLAVKTDFYYITEPLNNFRQHNKTIRSSIKIRTQIIELYAIFYEFISNNQLARRERALIKKGAGAVWFAFCLENPKQCLLSFPKVLATVSSKYDTFASWYIITGAFKTVGEIINAKKTKGR